MRAGGGTRIKVLEAFSHRRAVISTSIGMEGIDAVDDVHVLTANTPEVFAERCVRLWLIAFCEIGCGECVVVVPPLLLARAIKRTIAALFVSPVY